MPSCSAASLLVRRSFFITKWELRPRAAQGSCLIAVETLASPSSRGIFRVGIFDAVTKSLGKPDNFEQ